MWFPKKLGGAILVALSVYAGQEATVRSGHGIMNWFKIGKGE